MNLRRFFVADASDQWLSVGSQRHPSNKLRYNQSLSRLLSVARFIKFRDHGSAAKALEELSGAEVQGRTLRLSRAAGR